MDEVSLEEPVKGLENLAGQNNCFLNVVIQALWNLKEFRKRFLSYENHNHLVVCNESNYVACIFCALKIIFTQYVFGEEDILPPTALRKALSLLFEQESRFQVGNMGDASEALDEILCCLHKAVSSNANDDDSLCEPSCFVHEIFALNLLDQQICINPKCQATSEPSTTNAFIYYTYAFSLRSLSKRGLNFDRLMNIVATKDKRPCSNTSHCSELAMVRQYLLNEPKVFIVAIVWDTISPSHSIIKDTLNLIDEKISLSNVFSRAELENPTAERRYFRDWHLMLHHYDNRERQNLSETGVYFLKGMICYYGRHYNAYFQDENTLCWRVFDDATVKEIGSSWEAVKKRCAKGHFQPSILFYEHLETTDSISSREENDVVVSRNSAIFSHSYSDQTSGIRNSLEPSNSTSLAPMEIRTSFQDTQAHYEQNIYNDNLRSSSSSSRNHSGSRQGTPLYTGAISEMNSPFAPFRSPSRDFHHNQHPQDYQQHPPLEDINDPTNEFQMQ